MPVSRRTGVNITAIARIGGASIGRTAVVPFFKRLTSSSWQFLSDRVPDRIMLARRFKREFGRAPNLKNPRTFNEKLLWLMLYYRTPRATRLADKYEVRGYVAERVGPARLNELYGVWDRVSDIDFDTLPDAFVLKVNWGWGANVFCRRRSELDVPKTKEQLAAWMRRSHYWSAREWCYKNIEPRIVCERLLTDDRWGIPPDYKFFCFGGEPRFVKVHTDRFGQHGRGALRSGLAGSSIRLWTAFHRASDSPAGQPGRDAALRAQPVPWLAVRPRGPLFRRRAYHLRRNDVAAVRGDGALRPGPLQRVLGRRAAFAGQDPLPALAGPGLRR
jgi:hypothetical protein